MTFKEAFKLMKEGKKVKRPVFRGYWFINPENGEVMIHIASGKDISYGKLDISIKNTLADDWEEAKPEEEHAEEKPTAKEHKDESHDA